MSPPTNKRKRTNSSSAESSNLSQNNVPTPGESYYFKDGNIVLIAENVAFRVHQGLMAHHSEIFRDMLALGDQPADAETFDGCPAVRLSDSLGDILVLLRALFDCPQLSTESVETVAAIFRMSTKYLIQPLITSAMLALNKFYPYNLEDWDAYPASAPTLEDVRRGPPEEVLALIGADILLPAAHYELCRFRISTILEFDPKLPQHVLKAHFRGREVIGMKLVFFLRTHVFRREISCENCGIIWTMLEGDALELLQEDHQFNTPNPLLALHHLSTSLNVSSLCRRCRQDLLDSIAIERENIWSSLPKTFGLGSWGKLIDAM